MTPDQIAHQVRRLLDASADNLPPHILARLEAARSQALSRLDARRPHTPLPAHAPRPAASHALNTAHPTSTLPQDHLAPSPSKPAPGPHGPQPDAGVQGRPRAGSAGSAGGATGSSSGWAAWIKGAGWSIWPAWARLGLAALPVVLVATLLALPALDPAAPDDHLSAGNTSPSTTQQLAHSQPPNAPATLGQHEAHHAQAPITVQAPQTAEAPEASEALEASATLAAATTAEATNPLTAQQEAEPPLIVYRHAFTRPPDMSIPVIFPQASGFTHTGAGTPVSFTLPMTPNPTPPLSSLDLPPP